MKHTHRNRLKEARKKRREYIWQKITFNAMSLFGCFLALISALTFFVVLALYYGSWQCDYGPCSVPTAMLNGFLLALVPGILTYCGLTLFWKSMEKAQAMPYVPPVLEQPADIPAEEVLLRGSDQTAARPEELLRAAQAGTETDEQELLRAGTEASQRRLFEIVKVTRA